MPLDGAAGVGRRLGRAGVAASLTPLVTIWVALIVYLALTQSAFLTGENIKGLLEQNSITFVVAIAMTVIVIMGGIDLSSGGLLALSGLVLTRMNHGMPELLAVVLTVLAGGALGAVVNGLPVGLARMNPFVVTLGAGTAFRGLANVLTDGNTEILNNPHIVTSMGGGEIGFLPVPVVIMAVVFALFAALLRWTYLGRDVYAIGGNQEAARMAGIRVSRVLVIGYLLLGLTVGLASVMQAGRLASVAPSAGSGLELSAVAAVLLGGTSLGGGKGGVAGTLVAVLFLGTVDNGLTISGVSTFWKDVATGSILIAAVGFDQFRRHYLETRKTTTKEEDT